VRRLVPSSWPRQVLLDLPVVRLLCLLLHPETEVPRRLLHVACECAVLHAQCSMRSVPCAVFHAHCALRSAPCAAGAGVGQRRLHLVLLALCGRLVEHRARQAPGAAGHCVSREWGELAAWELARVPWRDRVRLEVGPAGPSVQAQPPHRSLV
jgi:hypothetical protein